MKKRAIVQSSNIHSVGYDAATKKLHVQFKGAAGKPGKVAEYDNVPSDKHAALIGAESKGSFFHAHIRGNEAHPWRYV